MYSYMKLLYNDRISWYDQKGSAHLLAGAGMMDIWVGGEIVKPLDWEAVENFNLSWGAKQKLSVFIKKVGALLCNKGV